MKGRVNLYNCVQLITLKRHFCIACFLLLVSTVCRADCINYSHPNCSVYTSCFAKYCSCKNSPDEYFESYGERYCQAFLGDIEFSDKGKKWRDSTLICLQEKIIPNIDLDGNKACDCKSIKKLAYDSHVSCYTSAGSSICDLPISDVVKISRVVKIADTLSSEGWKQMHSVSNICSAVSPDDGRRALWKAIDSILSLR